MTKTKPVPMVKIRDKRQKVQRRFRVGEFGFQSAPCLREKLEAARQGKFHPYHPQTYDALLDAPLAKESHTPSAFSGL